MQKIKKAKLYYMYCFFFALSVRLGKSSEIPVTCADYAACRCDETRAGGKEGWTDEPGGKRRDEQRKELGKRSVKEMVRIEIGCEIIFFYVSPTLQSHGTGLETPLFILLSVIIDINYHVGMES